MILVVHTADPREVFVGLIDKNEFVAQKKFKAQYKQAEKLLPEIDKLSKGSLKKLQGIAVVAGPGTFTALRIGVTTANALAWALSLPVAALNIDDVQDAAIIAQKVKRAKKGSIIVPAYGQEPIITKKQ